MTIHAGQAIPPLAIPPVRLADIVTVMDVMGDVNPVHVDEALVARLGLRGPVNQGPANAGYVLNMLLAWIDDPTWLHAYAFRFESMSVPDDELLATGTITSVDVGHDHWVVRCATELTRQGDVVVLTGEAVLHVPTDRVDDWSWETRGMATT